jgi:diguanylate cyclase (GGDEF)-like protein/PAS domain S-box-containing protein
MIDKPPEYTHGDSFISANILIVDDAPVDLKILSSFLKDEGYKVRTAESGERALEDIESFIPDLIILDIMMPHMDGYSVCNCIKNNPITKEIPIIFISSLDRTEDKVRAFQVGGVDYITKPIQYQEVFARVANHLSLRNLQKQLQDSKSELENRVRERTAELEKINNELHAEIAERKQTEAALKESEERYALAVRGSNDGIWDWDLRDDHIYLSPRWKMIIGYEDNELESSLDEWFNRIDPFDLARVRMAIFNHLDGTSIFLEEEYRIMHKDDTYRYVLTRGIAVRDNNGKAYRIVGSQTDITYRKRMEEQLHYDAFYDNLTALPNRALFFDRLDSAIELAKKHEGYHFAVIVIDVNHFKSVNEIYGFHKADMLLAEISYALKGLIRPVDTAARIGEDEFGVLFEDVDSREEIDGIIKEIHRLLSKSISVDGQDISVSISLGVVFGGYTTSGPFVHYEKADEVIRDINNMIQEEKKENTKKG